MDGMKIALKSMAAGAVLMYLFDPDRGKRRRAGIRDRAVGTWHDLAAQLDKAGRDFSNRAQGLVAEVKGVMHEPDRSVVVERVRSRIGRAVSHPHAITVTANDGSVVLQGLVLQNEVDRLLRAAKSVPGVRSIEDRLEVHEGSEHISQRENRADRTYASSLRRA